MQLRIRLWIVDFTRLKEEKEKCQVLEETNDLLKEELAACADIQGALICKFTSITFNDFQYGLYWSFLTWDHSKPLHSLHPFSLSGGGEEHSDEEAIRGDEGREGVLW